MKEHHHDVAYADELLRLAKSDLDSAEKLLKAGARVENACFFAEQCIEKSLKVSLIKRHTPYPHVHDLGFLLGKLPADECPPESKQIIAMEVYAAQRRYEEGPYAATEEDGRQAIRLAQATLKWARSGRVRK